MKRIIIPALLFAILSASCAKQIIPSITPPTGIMRSDTVVKTETRTVTDSVFIAGEYHEVHDSVPCPPGLTHDSLVYITSIVYVPGKLVPVKIDIHDTVRTVQMLPATFAQIMTSKYSWGERLSWLALVAFLMIGWLKTGKKKQPDTNTETTA